MGCTTFLVIFLSLFQGAPALHRTSCPIACDCAKDEHNITKVSCKGGYWNTLPLVPPHTEYLMISGGNFSTLGKPNDCWRFRHVKDFVASGNKITAMAIDAFECMQWLEKLTLNSNKIQSIIPGTLSSLTKLTVLNLRSNNLVPKVFKEIGMLKNLWYLDVIKNNMIITRATLEFLSNNTKLAVIEISGNNIQGTFSDVIKPLRRVSVLTAEQCNISSVDAKAFEGFHSLTTLSLSKNKIKQISPSAFANLAALNFLLLTNCFDGMTPGWLTLLPPVRGLSIDNNKLTSIPKTLNSLTELNIANNPIKKLGSEAFIGLKHLQKLVMHECHIESIHKEAFRYIPNVTYVNLHNNRIDVRGLSNMSYGLANSSLLQLDLGSNNLRNLTKFTFQALTPNKLQILSLRACKIEKVEPNTFENFGHLKTLYMESNGMTFLARDAFKGLRSLETLILSQNRLRTFYGIGIGGPMSLKSLSLTGNNIHEFEYGTLRGLNDLKVLKLSANSLNNIPSRLFENTKQLQTLFLSLNRISSIQPNAFLNLKNLTEIILKNNFIGTSDFLHSGLQTSSNLERLDFSSNTATGSDLEALKVILQRFQKLHTLQLSRCSVKNLLPDMFSSNSQLNTLILTFNGLSQLEPSAFRNASSLTVLNLIGNQIRFVDFESFSYLPALRELRLERNPLLCTCDILFIIEAVTSNLLYMGQSGLGGMRCDSPKRTHGLTLKQLNLAITDCEGSWLAMLAPLGGCCGGVLAAFGVYFACRYRWHLRYLMFLARTGRRRYREVNEEEDYAYDAFIAYSEKDLGWVKEKLLPNLDVHSVGEGGFNFCLHHRDWLVGVDIVDNIITSIENSRRTIIVLSDNFATSHWCQYELAIAQMRLDADGTYRDLLVVVLLNNIAAKNLTPRLRFILTSKTYLPWSEDPEQQALFWKTLRRSLSRNV